MTAGEGLTAAEVADRAGTSTEFVEQLSAAGALETNGDGSYASSSVRRVRVVRSLVDGGLPLDGLAEAIRRGQLDLTFVDDPAYERFAALTDVTFRELSESESIPFELLRSIREATGSPPPEPEDRLRENELDVVPVMAAWLRFGIRPQVIERTLRAYGESLRRMAEVESDWWRSDVIEPIFARGGNAYDVGHATAEFSELMNDLGASDRLLLALWHGHQTNSWMRNIFEGFESVLAQAGLHSPSAHPPAIAFLDLTGYTRLTDERGDAAAAELAGQLSRLVQRTSLEHDGKPIKWLGDGVMFHFRQPGRGVLAALEMVEGARNAALPPAHVGLHAGPVLFQEGDYFGRTVNVASRIADYARQGEVLVSDEVVAASATTKGLAFEPIGPVELKGLAEAVSLHVARRAT